MDLDLALRTKLPDTLIAQTFSEGKKDLEKWDYSNHMSLVIMKRAIPRTSRGAMPKKLIPKASLTKLSNVLSKN